MQYEKEKVEQIVELANMRINVYHMLSSLYFKELTIEQIEFMSKLDLSGFDELDERIGQGAHEMKRALRRVDDGTREDLAVDYAHTFLAAGSVKGETRACPYESVFTSDQGLLMQDARDKVYKYMLDEHLAPDENLRIPDDHLSFMFDFMAEMSRRMVVELEAQDLKEARRLLFVQQSFHKEHLLNWIFDFARAVRGCCRTRFYGGVASVTEGFISLDAELMADIEEQMASL